MALTDMRPSVCVTLILTFAASVAPTAVMAQRTVSGILFDSLRARAPLPAAEVVLIGTGRRAQTDAEGRFVFLDVPDTARAVGYAGAWLDSLGLPPLVAPFTREGPDAVVTVVVATPSRESFQLAACGATFDASEGVLVGEVRNASGHPMAGVAVAAKWRQLVLARRRSEESQVATMDTTSASGRFHLCGVPLEATVLLQAASDSLSTDAVSVRIHMPEQAHDLVVGGLDVRMRVTGQIVSSTERSVAGALVSLQGDTSRAVTSDSAGFFMLSGLPARTSELTVRSLGHQPLVLELTPRTPALDIGVLRLEVLPPELEAVRVTADPRTNMSTWNSSVVVAVRSDSS